MEEDRSSIPNAFASRFRTSMRIWFLLMTLMGSAGPGSAFNAEIILGSAVWS
jgi:hypothetical protein